jgi:hypothetical protein
MTALIIYPYVVFHRIDSFFVKLLSSTAIVELMRASLHTVHAKVPGSNQHYSTSRLARIGIILPVRKECYSRGFEVFGRVFLKGISGEQDK